MSFIGSYKFEISNEDALMVLNTLRSSSIKYKNLLCKDHLISGEIPFYQLKKTLRICEDNSYKINITSSSGLTHLINKNHKRRGLVIGILISVLMLLYLSNIILKINITGCDYKTGKQIINYLSNNGVYYGKLIPFLDFARLEADIHNAFDNISFVDISSYNSSLNISIAMVSPHEAVIPDNHHPSDIISTKDAQIVKVNVSSGQLMSIVGSGVKKGDLLVSGIVDNKKGEYMYYHSIAQIWGKYDETIIFEQPLKESTEVTQNLDLTDKSISYFDLEFPLDNSKIKNNYYILDERKNSIQFLGICLPISVINRTYYTSSFIETTHTVEEAELIIENKIRDYEDNFLSSSEIVSKRIEKYLNNDNVRYEVNYTIIGEIGLQKEILLK